MMNLPRALLLSGAGLLAAGAALAQPAPGPGGGPGPRGERGQMMFQLLDLDRDGRITFAEAWGVVTERFNAADADRSGGLSLAEFATMRLRPAGAPELPADRAAAMAERGAAMFRGLDANRDGQLTLDEFRPIAEMRFRAGDANGDGAVTREELRQHGRGPGFGPGPGFGAMPGR